jgi:hypothetical protein
MEDTPVYGKRPNQSIIVYKFELYQTRPDVYKVHIFKGLTSLAAYKMIPANYKLCDEATIKSKDYYMIVQLKGGEDNICYYYVKND